METAPNYRCMGVREATDNFINWNDFPLRAGSTSVDGALGEMPMVEKSTEDAARQHSLWMQDGRPWTTNPRPQPSPPNTASSVTLEDEVAPPQQSDATQYEELAATVENPRLRWKMRQHPLVRH